MRQKAHIVALSVYRICRLARLLCRGSLRRAGDIRIPIPEDNRTRRSKIRSGRRICLRNSYIGALYAHGYAINID